MKMINDDGWVVEAREYRTSSQAVGGDGAKLVITRHGILQATVDTPEQVDNYVPLSSLRKA